MTLRAKKPENIKKRLKALFYGSAGAGKTYASIQFPKPYLIDCEKGAEQDIYVEELTKNGGVILQTNDFDETVNEVKALATQKHDYKTLIIDPLTVIWQTKLEQAERLVGNEFGRHYGEANKAMKYLLNWLLRLDMNVIITSHAKTEYGQNLSVLGQTFDCYKKLDYLFDLVLEIQKRGNERHAIVKKSRIKEIDESKSFLFGYNEIANLYGRDILEKEASLEILASKEQVDELSHLIDLLKIPEETYKKWLDKVSANSFDDMPCEWIVKCIDALKSKINIAA